MLCINCHKNVSDNLEFCPYCKCRLKMPARKPQGNRSAPAPRPQRPSNPTPAPPVRKAPPAPPKPVQAPPRQAPKPVPPPPPRPKPAPAPAPRPKEPAKPKEKSLGGNSFMAYFVLPAFIIFDVIVIFTILNSLGTSEYRTSGIFTVCAQSVHLICAVASMHGLKMRTFASLISLLVCMGVTVLQTAVSFLLFAKEFDHISLLMMLVTVAITALLTAIFTPYYVKNKKEFEKGDILFK